MKTKYDTPNGTARISANSAEASSRSSTIVTTGATSHLFAEKVISVLVDLFLQAPVVEKCIIYPEIIQNLGRYALSPRHNVACCDYNFFNQH